MKRSINAKKTAIDSDAEMEEAAEECDRLKTAKIRTTRMLNRESC